LQDPAVQVLEALALENVRGSSTRDIESLFRTAISEITDGLGRSTTRSRSGTSRRAGHCTPRGRTCT
jgi:hypothetical protein